jgi:hypothetical protein
VAAAAVLVRVRLRDSPARKQVHNGRVVRANNTDVQQHEEIGPIRHRGRGCCQLDRECDAASKKQTKYGMTSGPSRGAAWQRRPSDCARALPLRRAATALPERDQSRDNGSALLTRPKLRIDQAAQPMHTTSDRSKTEAQQARGEPRCGSCLISSCLHHE